MCVGFAEDIRTYRTWEDEYDSMRSGDTLFLVNLFRWKTTNIMAIPQWTLPNLEHAFARNIPARRIVGTTVTGPIKRNSSPTVPVSPTRQWSIPATMRHPWNYNEHTVWKIRNQNIQYNKCVKTIHICHAHA